jgi:4-amino-4-deoxy-L-arabinose transferase-like glycosyltransferase
MGRDEERLEVPPAGLSGPPDGAGRSPITGFLPTILLAPGLLAVVAAFVPGIPGGLRDPGQADLTWAPLMGLGLLLLLAAAIAIGLGLRLRDPDRNARRLEVALGGGIPLAIACLAGATHLTQLTSGGVETPPIIVALLVASLAVGVALPLALLATRHPRHAPAGHAAISPRIEITVIGLVVLLFTVAVALGIRQEAPFGWDESVYALISRHWLFGTPDTGWGIHRPPVLSILASIPMLVTRNEAAFRVIGLLFGCVTVGAVWLLSRRLFGVTSAIVAAVVVASAQPIQIDSGLLLNDLPATGLILLLLAWLWRVMEAKKIGWSILWLAPIAALAFYVRYGASVMIAMIGITAFLIWPGRIAAAWPRVLATAGLFMLLLLPHMIFAVEQTGAPWGIALLASSGAHSAYLGEAVVTYLAWLPNYLLGPLGAAVAIIGLLSCVVAVVGAIRVRQGDAVTRAFGLLLAPSVAQFAVMGLVILPQGRYIYMPMILLVVAGSAGLVRAASSLGKVTRILAWLGAGVLVLYLLGSVVLVIGAAQTRGVAAVWLRNGGRYIASHSAEDCSVLASDVPQITWYSGCATLNFGTRLQANRDALLTGADRWLVVRRDGHFQPDRDVLEQYLGHVLPGTPVLLRDGSGVVRAALYRFARAGG